jgi:hypothetical protein
MNSTPKLKISIGSMDISTFYAIWIITDTQKKLSNEAKKYSHFIKKGNYIPFSFAQDEQQVIRYSFSEFFQLIKNERDTIFILKDAIVYTDYITDSLCLIEADDVYAKNEYYKEFKTITEISKHVELDNVVFERDTLDLQSTAGSIRNCHFKKSLTFKEVMGVIIFNNIVKDYNKNIYFTSAVFKNNLFKSESDFSGRLKAKPP